MNPVPRSSLVDQTEAALLAGLAGGQWHGTLPGVRMLCRSLGVSPVTLQAATARLLERGVLLSNGPRRRIGISPEIHRAGGKPGQSSSRIRRVLCLTESQLPQMSHLLLQLLAMLRLESPHWDFRHRVVSIGGAKQPKQQWDRLIDTECPDALIAFRGGKIFADWCVARALPTVFIGGDPGDNPIPTAGVDLLKPITDSVAMFLHLGHRHICMPMFGMFPLVENRQREIMRQALQLAGLPFDASWHTPAAAQKDPDVVLNALTRIARIQMPTAFIVMTWVEFVTIASFLQTNRLRIPQDVSILLLGSSDSLEWFRPRLGYFDYPIRKLTRAVRQWIDHGIPTVRTRLIVPGHLVAGESTAMAPG